MTKVVCSYCEEEIDLEALGDKQQVCPHCRTPIVGLNVGANMNEIQNSVGVNIDERPKTISFVCQKTGQEFGIPGLERIVVGRHHFIDSVPEKRTISGVHCEFIWKDGAYHVTDLSSTNGTKVGPSKIDCLKSPGQPVGHDEILLLGAETFIVKLRSTALDPVMAADIPETSPDEQPSEDVTATSYRCRSCATESEEKTKYCPKCKINNPWD